MNKILFCLIIFLCINIFSQDYNIEHKQILVSSKEKRYEIKITYPVISVLSENIRGVSFKTYYGFNTFVRKSMETERDSFMVWMNDWELNEYNKEFSSEYEIGDSVFYADNSLISIQFYGYSYFAGAAHPNNWSFSINYDLDNSNELLLRDLLTAGWENKISEITISDLLKQKSELGIQPSEWLQEGAGPKEDNFKVFNIKKDGLLITFPTYQVGAYVEGPSEVMISYSEIKDIIRKDGPIGRFVK